MKKKQIKTKLKKGTKKSFFEVDAPVTATKIHLYSSGPEELNGKRIRLDLTKNLRGKSLELKLRICFVGNKLQAKPESIALAGSYIRRLIRKGTDYCEDSFEAGCKDSVVRIKPFLITRRRVSRAVLKELRKNSKKFLLLHVKTHPAEEVFSEIITNKLQKQLSQKLKKIYPLALCEIRVFEVLKKKEENKQSNN